MNYRVVLEYSINNDEVEQVIPLSDEVVAAIYEGRIAPEGIITNILDLTVDCY